MKLIKKISWPDEYTCGLTKELDQLSGLNTKEHYSLFYHYILADKFCKEEKCLAIRVPGGTVGGVWIDDDNVITKIVVDTEYVIDTYPDDINDIIRKFVGRMVEW